MSGYSGPVTITRQLQLQNSPSTWTPVYGTTITTTASLYGSSQYFYASNDSTLRRNQNWETECSGNGTYSLILTVHSRDTE